MDSSNSACYGSVGAFESVHRPSRRKRALSFILAFASILLCAGLISGLISGSSLTGRLSELLVKDKLSPESSASQSRPDVQQGFIENWGNQTPTAKIYARHQPVLDGVVDFYVKFPAGSSKLRAPNWFMGIPVSGRKAAALKQVEIAFLNGQIKDLHVSKIPRGIAPRSSSRMLLQAIKKFSKKTSSSIKSSSKKAKKQSASSTNPSFNRGVDCCLPKCAHAQKKGGVVGTFGNCRACSSKPDIDQCTSIAGFLPGSGGKRICRKLAPADVAKAGSIATGNIVPQFFDEKKCKNFGGSPPPPVVPLPVPSCAVDQNGRFAGCSACSNAKEYPPEDRCICDDIVSKSKPTMGVTVVALSNKLICPKPLPQPVFTAPPTTSPIPGPKPIPPKPEAKMCSHDVTKLNGNGQGCEKCMAKSPAPATADFPGNDLWACRECRDKNICNFDCKKNKWPGVWQCRKSEVVAPSPTPRPEPQCVPDKKLKWKSSSNAYRCQGFMCKKAGLLPSGEFGSVPYPKVISYPKSLGPAQCCPFVAQGLASATCHQMFGCEVPHIMKSGVTQWDLKDQVTSCKNFFCLQGVSSPAEWSQKKDDSRFADGRNKGRSTCCAKLLAGVPDGKENWCPAPVPDPSCTGPDCEPIVPMDPDECQNFLCEQKPMISNLGDSYALWLESQRSSESNAAEPVTSASSAQQNSASSSAASKTWKNVVHATASAQQSAASSSASMSNKANALDPNVARCIRTLKLSEIDSWETSSHCVKEEDEKIEEEHETGEEEHETGDEEAHASGGEAVEGEEGSAGGEVSENGSVEETLEQPELEPQEIPDPECDADEGTSALPLLPGADVLGYTYDPDFGMKGCNFDRCVMRPFIKYTYKECKMVETPAGMFKLPDQIYAYNLFQTSAQTHIYQNEKEERASISAEATISGSYGPGSASMSMSFGQSGDSKSKQHIAVRKIDVHLYRLTLLGTTSLDHLHPAFVEAFKALPPRFEDNAHEYLQFVREWGRYVPSSGTFGGSLEIRMKFFSGEDNKKEDFSMGVEAAYDGGMFSVSGSAKAGYSKEAKTIENNNEISIDSSGGDPAVAALIADLKSPEEMSYRHDVETWLVSLPKYPRLVEDWPTLQVLTAFIPSSPSEDGSFDPFTRKQGLLEALRILHDVDTKKFFDDRKCSPPFAPPTPSPSPAGVPSPSPADVKKATAGTTEIEPKKKKKSISQGNGVVTVFSDRDYQGRSLSLPEGDYDCDDLRNMDFDWVNSISSVKVKSGYWIYVWDKPGWQGARTYYGGNYPNLNSYGWNDRIQSIRVVSTDNYYQNHENWQNGEMTCDAFGAQQAREREAARAVAEAEQKRKDDIAKAQSEKAHVDMILSRKKKALPSGRTSIAFNDYDRIMVGQCLAFDAVTNGGIHIYFFSSPKSQSDAYSFHIGTTEVKFEKGFSGTVIKQTGDTNALAYGQSQLSQNVWFCIYPESEDSSITVFAYGRGSRTLFEVTRKEPIMINYFAIDCTQQSTYRNIAVLKASRLLDTVTPFNRACKIVNCEKTQESESESGTCACEQCDYGYQSHNNNQECVVADQCIAQFGCLSANPPNCICEECCCGLSYDPVSNNCINANFVSGEGLGRADIETLGQPEVDQSMCPSPAVNKMATKFKTGSSYRLKKLMFSCTETNVQNIRLSYDTSKPALGFIDYDSTHLLQQSDTAGKFDFSMYDNLRKSIAANPLYSASGFLNLDEVKLEEVTLTSMSKKAGNLLQDAFKFMAEGAKQFAKDVDKTMKTVASNIKKTATDIKNKAIEIKDRAVEIAKDVKSKVEQLAKIADTEVKKFMKAADKVYKSVVSVVQKVAQGAVDFVSQNAGLLKVLVTGAGGIAGALATALPQLMNAIPYCQAWCGIVVSGVANAAIAGATLVGNGVIDLAVHSKKSGQNPLAFLSSDLKDIPADIMKVAGPILEKATQNVKIDDILKFANSSGAQDIINAVSKGGMNNFKDVFNDPGLKSLGDNLMSQGSSLFKSVGGDSGLKSLGDNLLSQGSSLLGNVLGSSDVSKIAGDVAATGLSAVSPLLDKVIPGAGGILSTASQHILPGLTGLLGGLFKKRSLLSSSDDHSSELSKQARFENLFFDAIGKFAQGIAQHAQNAFNVVSTHVDNAGKAIKSEVSKHVENIGNVGKTIAGGLDRALGTDIFSKGHQLVHDHVGGGIKNFVNGAVDGFSGVMNGAMKAVNDRIQSVLDPNRAQREYMNSQEYKDKMAAKQIFETFSKKLELPSNMPKYLSDSIVQWIMGEMKVTPLGKQPFLTNLNAENQCVPESSPNTCTEGDIKCIVLANKCFLDDEECVRAALKKVPTDALEKYAATHHLDFPGSSYGRYIRFSAPVCKKRANALGQQIGSKRSLLSQSDETGSEGSDTGSEESEPSESEPVHDQVPELPDADTLFANQTPLVFGLTSKFWQQPGLSGGLKKRSLLSSSDDHSSELSKQARFENLFFDAIHKLIHNAAQHAAQHANNAHKNQGSTHDDKVDPKNILGHLRNTFATAPFFEGRVSNLDFPSITTQGFAGSKLSTDFIAQFSGGIFVPITGSWTFHLTSDDGSRLYIDNNQVIDNDGYHGMVEVSQTVVLSRGMHSIEVSFFQGNGGAGLTLAWSGPSMAKQIIPTKFFLLNSKDVPLSLPRENSCNLDNNLQISQIAVFDPFGTNVALNKPCDAINLFVTDKLIPYLPAGPENVYPLQQTTCERAVDGNLVNRNGNEIFQSNDPDSDSVTFDLGQDVFIKRIMYWNRKDCCQSMMAGATLEIIAADGNVVNSEVLNNKLVQSFDFPSSQSRATLFTECNYHGEQVAIGPGNYKFALLQIPKSSLSAIKLPNNLEIKLFEGESFDGKSTPWIHADVPCLDGFQFNDRTGSVQVRERSKFNTLNDNEVVFHDACDYKGNSMTLIPGTYSASQLSLTRNSIMSVLIPSKLEVELYSFDHFGGRSSGWLQKSFSCLTDIDFSRTTVSLVIRRRSTPTNRKLLSNEEQHRNKLISVVLPHAAQHAFYVPKDGDSESAKKVLRLAVQIAHHGAHAIAESHMHHREMVAGIAKWVPHQYVLSALKMDLEMHTATSAFAQTCISRVHKSLFTRLTEIVDTVAQNALNTLDQTVVNILGEAYAPVTLPGPCFSRDLIMSYLPTSLRVGIDTWVEMEQFSWIQEIRVDSVDTLLKDPTVVQSEKYFVKGMAFKISQYKSANQDSNEMYSLVRGIEITYQKSPSFGGPGDSITTFIGKREPDSKDPVAITDCSAIEFENEEFLLGMSVVILPEGLAGIHSVMTNKREILAKCGQKASGATDLTSDDGVVWMYCNPGYDAVGISGKFDSRVMRTVELQCSPTNQADRIQYLGVYSYSFKTDEFFNGIGADSPGYKLGYWGTASSIGITQKKSKDFSDGWDLRVWTNRVPPISPITGVPPVGVTSNTRSESQDKANRESYKKISESNDLVTAMAPPDGTMWYYDTSRSHYTDINRLSFAENTKDGSIKGVYVDYSARSDLYSGYMLNDKTDYKNLRIKTLKLERNEYWTGLKVGLDPVTGALDCITGVKTSINEYGILCGSRDSKCLKKSNWIICPSNTPMMVALQEDFNSNNELIGLTPICASLKATRFDVNEFTVMFEEDEFMNQMTVRTGCWLDSILGVNTNKRNIPLQCGRRGGGFVSPQLSVPSQFEVNKVTKGKAVIGFQVDVAVDDQFGVFADQGPIEALSSQQKALTPAASQAIAISKNDMDKNKGPGPSILKIMLMSSTFDSEPQSAFMLESPEEAGRSRIPEFYETGIYHQPTFDMAFDFYKPRLAQFQQISSFEFQCQRGKSTAKDFWMPWFQFSFTNGEKYIQGEISNDRLAVKKRLQLSAQEYMIRIELSSHKDKGYAITGIKTNVKYYPFRCGQSNIALDVPSGGKHLIIGLAGNLQTSADSPYFINLQALYLKLNEFIGDPTDQQLNP